MKQRGTSNTNLRGNSKDRAARKHYLLVTFGLFCLPGIVKCSHCPALLDYFTVTVDLIHEGIHGGRYVRGNIQPACMDCNIHRGNETKARITPSERKERHVKIDEQVRQMHPPRYTTAQAAPLVGRDVDTLRRWKRKGVFRPSERRPFGRTMVDLYTNEDIEAMRQIAKEIKPGKRPAKTA